MNVADADQTIIIPMTAGESSVLNADHGNAGTVTTENITTHKRKGRVETLSVTSAMKAIPMEGTQAQELNLKDRS